MLACPRLPACTGRDNPTARPERPPRETARDYAVQVICSNIVNLNLEPGSLVSENELFPQTRVSRSSAREASIDLPTSGIVQIVHDHNKSAHIDAGDERHEFRRRTRKHRPRPAGGQGKLRAAMSSVGRGIVDAVRKDGFFTGIPGVEGAAFQRAVGIPPPACCGGPGPARRRPG